MAAASMKSAAVCKKVLQQSLLRRLDGKFLPQLGPSERSWSRYPAAYKDHCKSLDGFVARGRDESSRGCEMGRGEQEMGFTNHRQCGLATMKVRTNSLGTTKFYSSSNLRQFSTLSGPPDFSNVLIGSTVAVGISGGVDSSIAALLLQRRGYRVFGIFMRNWNSSDEAGSMACSMEQDYEDARRVCKHLGIKLYEVDYQRRYWMDVFESFTRDCAVGLTPNPDLACNQHIKFDALLENANELGADRLATGHYARLVHPQGGKPVQLLRAIDKEKDQSYFLASVAGHALERVIFPLGSLCKSEVRNLAVSEGLITANKRSSAGICFVGRRNFADFISEYVDMNCGPFISVEDGSQVGTHEGIAAYTHGQRARIGGKPEAFYVVGKDVSNNAVFVALGPNHPGLFCTSAVADSLAWIAGEPPPALAEGRVVKCLYKARYRQAVEECSVCLASANSEEALIQGFGVAGKTSGEFVPSSFCRLQPVPLCGQLLQVRFTKSARAITPGQALVLYDGDVCLGAARLVHPGPTLFEQNRDAGEWQVVKVSSVEESGLKSVGI
ncbi:unnamed protein product [Calypogeia fissa]